MIDCYRYTDKEVKELLKSIVVIQDSREQEASHITKWFDEKKIPYVTQKLETADYSFYIPTNAELGIVRDMYFDDKIVIERKNSLEEISSCFTTTRTAFENEFIRCRAKLHLLIENASYEDIINHNYRTEYKPVSFLASLHSFADRYNFSITFMKDKNLSGQFIYLTFYYFLRNYLLGR